MNISPLLSICKWLEDSTTWPRFVVEFPFPSKHDPKPPQRSSGTVKRQLSHWSAPNQTCKSWSYISKIKQIFAKLLFCYYSAKQMSHVRNNSIKYGELNHRKHRQPIRFENRWLPEWDGKVKIQQKTETKKKECKYLFFKVFFTVYFIVD